MNSIMRVAIACLVLLLWQEPATASKPVCVLGEEGTELTKIVHDRGLISVSLVVKVPGRYEKETSYIVPRGTSSASLLEIDYKVLRGVVCCKPTDIHTVNGLVTNLDQNKYWVLHVNKDFTAAPMAELSDGDKVMWTYSEDPRFPKAVLNPEDWPIA